MAKQLVLTNTGDDCTCLYFFHRGMQLPTWRSYLASARVTCSAHLPAAVQVAASCDDRTIVWAVLAVWIGYTTAGVVLKKHRQLWCVCFFGGDDGGLRPRQCEVSSAERECLIGLQGL